MEDSLPLDYVPEFRPQPPWLMEEMVAAEPSLVGPILGARAPAATVAELVKAAVRDKSTVVVTGCGTSETAAMAVADLIAETLESPGLVHPRQALEASVEPWPGGVCIGISHEGSTRATILAMAAARRLGTSTALITARAHGTATAAADGVFVTPLIDRSWCHTVGYLSPILAGAAIAEALGRTPIDARALKAALDETLGVGSQAALLAETIFGVDRLITVGSGPDRSPARELALKIEEGVRLPARMLDLETVMHGHLAAYDQRAGLILVATTASKRVLARTAIMVQAARRIGVRVGAIVSAEVDQTFGLDPQLARIVLPKSLESHGLLGGLTGAALALQQLTIALARLAGTNPDRIRREQEPYREAARIAETSPDW